MYKLFITVSHLFTWINWMGEQETALALSTGTAVFLLLQKIAKLIVFCVLSGIPILFVDTITK